MKSVGKAKIGFVISIVMIALIVIVNLTVYEGVWPTTALIIVLVTIALFYRRGAEVKRKGLFWVVVFLFFTMLYVSIPKYTYQQAKEILSEKYDSVENNEIKTQPVGGNSFHPFALREFYFFKVKSEDEDLHVIVNPNTGKIIVLD